VGEFRAAGPVHHVAGPVRPVRCPGGHVHRGGTTVAPPDPVDDGPVRRELLTASGTEQAIELMRTTYVDHEPRIPAARRDAQVRIAIRSVRAPQGTFRLDRLRHSLGMDVRCVPSQQVTVLLPLAGRVRYVCRDEEATGLRLVPTWSGFDADWDDDADAVGHTIDGGVVAQVGAEMAGLEPDDVRFSSMLPIDPVRERHLVQVLSHLGRDTLDNPEALASPLVRGETLRHLAATVLLTFPNTALEAAEDPTRDGPGGAEPATIRRAVAYIEEHAHEPVGLEDIAAAARIGVRGLQHGFARYRETTPLGHLRRVRLERAHRELRSGDPTAGDTVAAIAARWGFAHGGRFSAEYRHVFGCAPSDTLRA
jgi:AraC-like DNA-binding protein